MTSNALANRRAALSASSVERQVMLSDALHKRASGKKNQEEKRVLDNVGNYLWAGIGLKEKDTQAVATRFSPADLQEKDR